MNPTERSRNITELLNLLIDERKNATPINIPHSLQAKQMLMRALLTMRPPHPGLTARMEELQNAELHAQLDTKGIVEVDELRSWCPILHTDAGKEIILWNGDITRLHVSAIVTSTDRTLVGKFTPLHPSLNSIVHSAAGAQLRAYMAKHLKNSDPAKHPIASPGYNLPAKQIIHICPPVLQTKAIKGQIRLAERQALTACYQTLLDVANKYKTTTLAIPSLSTGEGGYPIKKAASVAFKAISQCRSRYIKTFIITTFNNASYIAYHDLFKKYELRKSTTK